jgi:nicotinamidase-related amidase
MKTALLIIDVQNGLLESEDPVREKEALLGTLRSLIDRARSAGVPIVYVQDDDVGEAGSPAWEVHPAIAPAPADLRVRKLACDAFHETPLGGLLRERGVDHLIIAGCKTEFCIDTTCRRAVTLGYDVTLAADAHGTSDSPVLPASTIIAHENRLLDGFGALTGGRPFEIRVRPAAEIEL